MDIVVKFGPGEQPSEALQYILMKLMPEWARQFEEKAREYGNMHQELGTKGQYVDLNRKMGKLRKALWLGEDTTGWREQPREITMDLIGHCFLMLELMDDSSIAPVNEWDDAAGLPAPCQPIGCDHGHHIPGCVYAIRDMPNEEDADDPLDDETDQERRRKEGPVIA